uniref:Myb/SANT-like DNA-binding domain-containing protein 4 isoform X2 n=1 Tax=Crassostrea virginica TaxID=6565 RepID=A0A8B8EPK5_CRAVI|nr:myb/SANT-like DNA-binding domain-containing protein 4 isoform X2 [Crassostrea virginica]
MAATPIKLKKRSENFSMDEILFIVEEVEKYSDIITAKQSNLITNAKKAAAWQKVVDAVNSRGGVIRTVDQVRERYRKACSKAKGERIAQKQHRFKTGGGPPPPAIDAISEKILLLNDNAPNFVGIDGGVEVGGLVITEMPESDADPCTSHAQEDLSTFAEPQIISIKENTASDYATTTATVELPENLRGTSVTYDLVISEKGTEIRNQKKTVRKRKSEGSIGIEDLQRQVLREDLVRIREETALIRTQKQKVDLEILKLKLELASMQRENEM